MNARGREEATFPSTRQMRARMSPRSTPTPAAFEPGRYMRVHSAYTLPNEIAP